MLDTNPLLSILNGVFTVSKSAFVNKGLITQVFPGAV
jgi:hypothetical protein